MSLLTSLKNNKEFSIVSSKGRKYFAKDFLIIGAYLQEDKKFSSSAQILLGIKAGKKLGNAVIRNKIRRRIKHLVRNLAQINIFNNQEQKRQLSMIFIPRKNFEQCNFFDLQHNLNRIVKQISKY